MSEDSNIKGIRHPKGDALVKDSKPINHHYGTPPKCQFCEIAIYQIWECNHPKVEDTHGYVECCTEFDWKICPFNNERKCAEGEE